MQRLTVLAIANTSRGRWWRATRYPERNQMASSPMCGHLEVERQHRHRHRQSSDAFAVDVGANHAIAVDGDPRRVTPRHFRVRQIAAVAEMGDDPGQGFP